MNNDNTTNNEPTVTATSNGQSAGYAAAGETARSTGQTTQPAQTQQSPQTQQTPQASQQSQQSQPGSDDHHAASPTEHDDHGDQHEAGATGQYAAGQQPNGAWGQQPYMQGYGQPYQQYGQPTYGQYGQYAGGNPFNQPNQQAPGQVPMPKQGNPKTRFWAIVAGVSLACGLIGGVCGAAIVNVFDEDNGNGVCSGQYMQMPGGGMPGQSGSESAPTLPGNGNGSQSGQGQGSGNGSGSSAEGSTSDYSGSSAGQIES